MSERTIIDQVALSRNRRRAVAKNEKGADFLLRFVAEDIILRLGTIKRDFETVVILNEPGDVLRSMFQGQVRFKRVFSTHSAEFYKEGSTEIVTGDEAVPFKDNSLDLLVSLLTGQFINDLPGFFIQIRRAIRPDGLFLATFLGGNTLHELRSVLLEAEAEITGDVYARTIPFVDVRDAGALLQRAGFALPVTDSDVLTVRYDGLFNLMRDLRAMGAQNVLTSRSRKFLNPKVLELADQFYRDRYSDEDGRVRVTFELISVSGWVPHESQQKPLKPGSAKISLREVLGDKNQ